MFIGVQLTLVVICTLVLWLHDVYSSALTTLNQAFFQVVSMATTAGFTTDSIARWPLFLPVLLLCSAFIGGCAGSTGGGLKVIRILLLFKQGNRELKRLVHPNAVYSIKLGNRALPERILEAVWGSFLPMRWCSLLACWRSSRPEWMTFRFRLGCGNVKQPRARTWRSGGQLRDNEPGREMDLDC